MNKYIKYTSYVIKHKWFVFLECLRLGKYNPNASIKLGLFLRGIVHDMSKFGPFEFSQYMEYFAGKDSPNRQANFDRAWNHHQKFNKHHWQHHILLRDDGSMEVLEMPELDAYEMVADWVGAGIAIHGRREIKEWYKANYDKIQLHPNTRGLVDFLIFEYIDE